MRVRYRKKVPIHIFCYFLLFSNLLTGSGIRTSDLNCSLASGSHFCLLLIFSFISFFSIYCSLFFRLLCGWFRLKRLLICLVLVGVWRHCKGLLSSSPLSPSTFGNGTIKPFPRLLCLLLLDTLNITPSLSALSGDFC